MNLLPKLRLLFLIPVAIVVACSHGTSAPSLPAVPAAAQGAHPHFVSGDKIKHIVFIIQENRTFDNIFGGSPSNGDPPFPGADAATHGTTYDGKSVELTKVNIDNPIGHGDPNNYHAQWLLACNAPADPPFAVGGPSPCRMNGFSRNASPQPGYDVPSGVDTSVLYSYANRSEVAPYWFIAKHYAVGDRFFMGHNSESYTGHQFIFASQSNNTVDSPVWPSGLKCGFYHRYCAYVPWGCDSPDKTMMYYLNPMTGIEAGPTAPPTLPKPCYGVGGQSEFKTVASLMEAKKLDWRIYARSMCSGIVALNTSWAIRHSSDWPNQDKMKNCYANYGYKEILGSDKPTFAIPEYSFLADEKTGPKKRALADLTYVLPGPFNSDHPGVPYGYCGPQWVASVINAIGKTSDWDSTAIFVFWDDWGGFYDHVAPYVVRDQAGPGFRVPLLVVSPYVRKGVIHSNAEFATLNRFVETTFGLGSLNATDASPYVNNLDGFFDFNAPPQKFQPIPNSDYTTNCKNYFGSALPPGVKTPRWLQIDGADND